MSAPEMFAKSPMGGDGSSSTAAVDADYYRRLLDRLFSMLSHDLRTPLSAISGWLFLLESDKLDAAGRKRALDKIRTNVDEEVRLIDDMLALVRVRAGTLKLERSSTDLAATIVAAVEKTRAAATAKKVVVEFTPPGGSELVVDSDAPRLQRALELIIEHGIRDGNGADPKITVTTAAQGSGVDIEIRGSGRGIAPDALRWVTDPFGSPPDPESGSRHGPDRCLLIAAALVEALGGRFSVASAGEGTGTTVTLHLPRAPDP